MTMRGYVYAIGNETGAVKIGFSLNPKSRLPFLRTGHPGKLTLLGFVPAFRSQEAEIHALLSRWRITGEWFRLEGAVRDFVKMLGMPSISPVCDVPAPKLDVLSRQEVEDFRSSDDVCECCELPSFACALNDDPS